MNFLKNLKIGARLGLGFGLVIVLLIAVAVLSTIQLGRVNDNVLYSSENTMPSLKAVAAMRSDLGDIRRLEANHIMVSTEPEMDEFETRISKSRNSLETGLKGYEKLLSDDEDKKRWQAASSATAEYVALWDKLRPMSRKTITDPTAAEAAQKLLFGDSRKAFAAATAGFETMWEYNEQSGVKAAKDSQAAYSAAMLMLSLLSGLACMLGIWAAWFITRSITRPINQAVKVAQTVAAGDLTSEIDVTSRDETGQLLTALKAMNKSLVGIVSNVRQSSDSIATGSAQIATGNADLSQRTEEQASNLQQTAASMEQLTSTVKQNSDTARQANQLATSASEAAAKGGVVVGEVVSTMEAITASSKKISDIISVIDGIAFQTNILALNAAVEAARAGEQGRGFAVVASEVRSLAQRSATAAKEIKTLIGQSVENVQTGSRLVGDAGKSMQDIVSQVKRVNDLIAEISSASVEQSQGISQVGEAVTQLDQVTQQNAALVEESAAAAESLKQQAANLAEVVSVFRLAGDMGAGSASYAAPLAANAAVAERRSPNRAANVSRPAFKAKPAGALPRAEPDRSPDRVVAKTGTDNWDTF